MPPELLRFVVPYGSEGDGRKHADRLGAAVPGSAVFFGGQTVFLHLDADEWPPRALAESGASKELDALSGIAHFERDRLDERRVPRLGAWGAVEGRAVAVRATTTGAGARRVCEALAALGDRTLREHGIGGWALFDAKGDLLLVLRGGDDLAERTRDLLLPAEAAAPPATDPHAQRTVPSSRFEAEPQGSGPVASLRRTLFEATTFDGLAPDASLLPNLLTVEDGAALRARPEERSRREAYAVTGRA